MMRPYAGIRQTIANLGRPDLAILSQALGVGREVLTDFADIGIEPGADILAKLESWYEIVSLRRALNTTQNARVRDKLSATGDMIAKSCGISVADYDAFLTGTSDLDPTTRGKLRDFVVHGGFIPQPAATLELGAAPTAPAPGSLSNGAPLSELLALRGKAKTELNAMTAEELRTFIASRKAA